MPDDTKYEDTMTFVYRSSRLRIPCELALGKLSL